MPRVQLATSGTRPRATDRLSVGLADGRTVHVEITGKRTRIDVRLDRRWIFDVDDNDAELVTVLDENGRRVDGDLPEWIEPLLQRLGLEGIDG